ncbi:MAG: hypothetical protein M9921_14745 [Fimbriimonadaceae bacterium]|nr:hypothetical protein [Fimbriimonadaceae bacterium]
MLGALILVALASQNPTAYDTTLVLSMPTRGPVSRTWIGGVTLLEDDTVAGFTCDSVGVHGETFFAKPFVWSKGTLSGLPLGKAEYGHVYAGTAQLLVGDVMVDHRDHPATWTPDPQGGWAKARLTVLPYLEGRAVAVTPERAVWVAGTESLLCWNGGKWSKLQLGSFILEGIDAKGRFYGNRFQGFGEGMSPQKTQPAIRNGTRWIDLVPEGSYDWLNAVNRQGLAVGRVGSRAVLWKSGATTHLFDEKVKWSDARAINGLGQIVGAFTFDGTETHAYVWKDGALRDLWNVHRDGMQEALAINDRGVIVAKAEAGYETRLYLLTPKGRELDSAR